MGKRRRRILAPHHVDSQVAVGLGHLTTHNYERVDKNVAGDHCFSIVTKHLEGGKWLIMICSAIFELYDEENFTK